MRQILFADNDPDFLETRSEFLEQAGYRVVKATSVTDAKRCLREIWTPIAILDIRLEDDDDDKDWSGVALAKSELCRSITKIVLTHFPSALVNELLAIASGNSPQIVVEVLHKQDGPEKLVQTLEKALGNYVRINFSLTLDWQAANPFALVSRIEPGLEGERLLNRAEELEDLFRRLFYEKDRIRIDRVLWQRDGRVALTVFAFRGAVVESFVVVCGQNARVVEEANRFDKFAPKAQGETSTTLADKAETTHFAANAYALAQADLETIRALGDVYRTGDKKVFTDAVETLFEKTLFAWQGSSVPAERPLEDLYRERLGLTAERISPQAFQARRETLARYLPELKKAIPNPEPIIKLLQSAVSEQSTLKIKSPGTLAGDNVLVDANSHAWLTDFADAGDAPQFWNFVALESVARFDWIVIPFDKSFGQNLERYVNCLSYFEECLLDDGNFVKPEPEMVEFPPARQWVKTFIHPIRKLARSAVGKEYRQYHLGIFFHAARRLADFDPTLTPTPNERARFAHALIAMALIAAKVGIAEHQAAPQRARGLRVDKHGVTRDGKRLKVRGQSRTLLNYLAEHCEQMCSARELIENVMQDKFDQKDKRQIGRLQTAIRRLREKIEYDPDHPHYLLTEADGYRLVPQSDE